MTVVVVGGGVAGLVAARSLTRRGATVILLEASDLLGGALRSTDLGSVRVDVGAEAFAVTRPEALALIDELGLSDRVIRPRRSDARILTDSGAFAMPHALLGIPTNLSAAEVVAIIGTDAVADAKLRDCQPLPARIDPQITLGELTRLRMGDVVVAQIVTPVVGGVHAIDPDLVEADAVAPGLIAALESYGSLAAAAAALRSASGVPGAAVAGLDGGMTTLASALARDVKGAGASILTGTMAVSIHEADGRWTVQTPTTRIGASAVVLAIDAPQAAALLTALPAVHEHLASITVGDVAVVSAVLTSNDLDGDPMGSGVLIAPGVSGVRAKAMTHATAKWSWVREAYGPGRHLVRLSYGRNGQIAEDFAQLPDVARTDLELICGIRVREFDAVNVTRWPRSLVQQRPGHRARVAALRAAVSEHPSLAIVGAGIGGNGLAGTIAQARTAVDQVEDAHLRP